MSKVFSLFAGLLSDIMKEFELKFSFAEAEFWIAFSFSVLPAWVLLGVFAWWFVNPNVGGLFRGSFWGGAGVKLPPV